MLLTAQSVIQPLEKADDDVSLHITALIAMTHRPAVSVVVPVHNRHDLLVLAVNSILDQSVRNFEVIVVDDGSSPKIDLSLFQRVDARIRILRHERSRGAAAARNSGVSAAAGEWLAFLDSDDIWHPQKLEIQLAELTKWPAGTLLVLSSGWRYFQNGRPVSEISPVGAENISRFASGSWFYPGSTVLMRRETALQIGPQDETLPRLEDYDWYLRFALRGGKLAIVPMRARRCSLASRFDPEECPRGRRSSAQKISPAWRRIVYRRPSRQEAHPVFCRPR